MYFNDIWEIVDIFVQRYIDNNQIRYVNREKRNLVQYDRFLVEVFVLNIIIRGFVYIYVDRLIIDIVGFNRVEIQYSQYKIIFSDELYVRTNDFWYDVKNIKFIILRKSYRGNLYRIYYKNIIEELIYEMELLDINDVLIQEDVNSGYVVYRLYYLIYDMTIDFIDFRVFVFFVVFKLMRMNMEFFLR